MNLKNEYWDNFRFRFNNHCRLFLHFTKYSLLVPVMEQKKKYEFWIRKKYHQWVYASDDILNKILKLCVCSLYGYGIYVFTLEIWSKFFKV